MIDIIPKALYPLVPQAPGVPDLLRNAVQILDTATLGYLGLGDALGNLIGVPLTQWGVFNSNGQRIADYDSVFATAYRDEAIISDYPLEDGAFASYNKVEQPYDIAVTLHCGGSADRRGRFLAALHAARRSLELHSVLTPSKTHTNINWIGIDTRHEATAGANMEIVTLMGREVRNTAQAAYSEPQSEAAFRELDRGQLQPIPDTTIDLSNVV